MKNIIAACLLALFAVSCQNCRIGKNGTGRDTVFVHDTIMTAGVFTYNLPCKVEYIHPEQKGKAIMVFWLHGGVHDQRSHDLLSDYNHIDRYRNVGYNGIRTYLQMSCTKAVFLVPICHKAVSPSCVSWIDCAYDIKHIIDDYVAKGIADADRVYLLGSSDGGSGIWDLVEQHGDWFAAAMPMSCSRVRMTKVPIYFHNTSSDGDVSAYVDAVKAQGANITYQHHPKLRHGQDEKYCDMEHLMQLFSHVRGEDNK